MSSSAFELFVVQFMDVKRQAGSKPVNVGWRAKSDKTFEQRVTELWNTFSTASARLAEGKWHNVPAPFRTLYAEYLARWHDPVEEVGIASVMKWLENLDFNTISKPTNDEDDNYFDPRTEDAARLVDEIFSVAQDTRSSWAHTDLGDTLAKAFSAWRFFQGPIGLDLDGISRRWKASPTVLIPPHVTARNATVECGGVYDLLSEAYKAFWFGTPRAALAMCRALLEMVLERIYGLQYDGPDKLRQLVVMAEQRYGQRVRTCRLHEKRKLANAVLHDGQDIEEAAVLDFLNTLKTLIEAPQR